MPKTFKDLAFDPAITEIVPDTLSGSINVFTGANNSGKSAYLKQTVDDPSKLYIGVDRFYSIHHLPLYTENEQEVRTFFSNLRNAKTEAFKNFEGSYFNTASAITRLSNDRRRILFDLFEEMFDTPVEVRSENPDNDFSNRYVAVGGDSLSITSSGTRLFLGLLAATMDERFSLVAIDEPELGLSPILQRRLADILIKGDRREALFPHRPNIVISTHSHLFLDKMCPKNNWIVSKEASKISARRCGGIEELHDLQLRLLGNDLGELFLPHAVIFVEGNTDKIYLDRIMKLRFPRLRVVIQECGGDIARRLSYWSQSIGNIQVSPYRYRTFAIYDQKEQAGLDRVCNQLGLPETSKIKWSGNGIEFVYPQSLLRQIFFNPALQTCNLSINGDTVASGGISYKKVDLCSKVCELLTHETELSSEVNDKLLQRIAALSG